MNGQSFESVVAQYYEPLYKFAFSLSRTEADACDLTQQTFYIWATKSHQLEDVTKTKTWLFTTLHRTFLQKRRRDTKFPHRKTAENRSSPAVHGAEHGHGNGRRTGRRSSRPRRRNISGAGRVVL